jgi:hypothetical protein
MLAGRIIRSGLKRCFSSKPLSNGIIPGLRTGGIPDNIADESNIHYNKEYYDPLLDHNLINDVLMNDTIYDDLELDFDDLYKDAWQTLARPEFSVYPFFNGLIFSLDPEVSTI